MSTGLVGGIVGAVSARSASSATLSDNRTGLDFAIGGLGFRVAITDQRPYERASAPYKKDQFDTAPTVGDQSLTGWWTRGQMSFHMGGGIDYYEVLDGETVLNRFNTSSSITPWTPGGVSLAEDSTTLTLANVKDLRQVVNLLSGDRIIVLLTDGTLREIPHASPWDTQTATALPTATGAVVGSITSGWERLWCTSETRVETYFVGDAATSTLWTSSDGRALVGVFYLKNRLWVVDDFGSWYMLSTAGGTFSVASDEEFTVPGIGWLISSSDLWSACETPASVLIAAYDSIWAVGVDVSSGTPTTQPPILAARLPNDETVSAIEFTAGYVTIATNKGVRFAAVSQDGLSLTYGPLVTDQFDHSNAVRVTSAGSRVLVPSDVGVVSYNLGYQVSDLVPGFALEYPITDGDYAGALNTTLGVLTWSSGATGINRTGSDLQSQGTLTTGYHRFGTLEPKQFHAVRVRVGGTGGSITLSRVMPDGSEVSIYTISAASPYEEDITLGLSEPYERVALKFTFNRDASDPTLGPVLLGYQLRAVPAPRRQRLIRVPLLLEDVEQRSPARATGRTGSAWTRLLALEDMEVGGSVYTYQDFRTGERGLCVIESVEFTNTTPPGPQDSGFGGVVSLTLRKID